MGRGDFLHSGLGDMMIRYSDIVGMRKKADLVSSATGALGNMLNGGIGGLGAAAYILLAATAPFGIATGAIGAKMNAADETDENDVQLQYDNRRMNSDIGYLKARIREEAAPMLRGTYAEPAKSVRML